MSGRVRRNLFSALVGAVPERSTRSSADYQYAIGSSGSRSAGPAFIGVTTTLFAAGSPGASLPHHGSSTSNMPAAERTSRHALTEIGSYHGISAA